MLDDFNLGYWWISLRSTGYNSYSTSTAKNLSKSEILNQHFKDFLVNCNLLLINSQILNHLTFLHYMLQPTIRDEEDVEMSHMQEAKR